MGLFPRLLGRKEGVRAMFQPRLTLAEIALIAGTRVALGAGIGLLLSPRLNDDQRKAIGWTLAAFGALTTIPLAMTVFSKAEGVRELRPSA